MKPTATVSRFSWHGQNRAGQVLSGVLYGENKDSIRAQLAQRGIVAQRIQPSREPWRRSVRPVEVTLFLQELTTLYEAGVPLLRILDVLIYSQNKPAFKHVIQNIRLDIERGEALHAALRHHPQVFDVLTCNLIESGETAGRLTQVLRNITYTQERRQRLSSQVKTAMAYPGFVIAVALVVWVVVLAYVVPVFEGIYKNAGKQLPGITQFLLDASRTMRANGWLIVLLMIIVGLFLFRWQDARWRSFVDRIKIKIPVFGGSA